MVNTFYQHQHIHILPYPNWWAQNVKILLTEDKLWLLYDKITLLSQNNLHFNLDIKTSKPLKLNCKKQPTQLLHCIVYMYHLPTMSSETIKTIYTLGRILRNADRKLMFIQFSHRNKYLLVILPNCLWGIIIISMLIMQSAIWCAWGSKVQNATLLSVKDYTLKMHSYSFFGPHLPTILELPVLAGFPVTFETPKILWCFRQCTPCPEAAS